MGLELLLVLQRRPFQYVANAWMAVPPGSATTHWRAYSEVATSPDSRQSNSAYCLLCGLSRHLGLGRLLSTPCAADETTLTQADSVPHRFSQGMPAPSSRYARPRTATCSPSRAWYNRTPVVRSTLESLGGSGLVPRPGKSGSHPHTPRCPVRPARHCGIAPKDLLRSLLEAGVQSRRLPIPSPMRLPIDIV